MDKYIKKYLKYKKMCIKLLKQKLCFDFYFVHNTIGKKYLCKILKDKYLKSSSETGNYKLFGSETSDIYSNIYFPDLNNLFDDFGIALLISPLVMFEMDITFRKGWQGYETNFLRKSDSIDMIKKNIKEIKKYIKNPEKFNAMYKKFSPMMTHECVFSKSISLEDYLLGIVCDTCDEVKIKKILIKSGLEDAKVYTNIKKLPSFDDLIN